MKYDKNKAREIMSELYNHVMTEAEFNALVKNIHKNRPKIKTKQCQSKKFKREQSCE